MQLINIKQLLIPLTLAVSAQAQSIIPTDFGAYDGSAVDSSTTQTYGDYTLITAAQTNNRLRRYQFTTDIDVLDNNSTDTYRFRIDARRHTGATFINGTFTAPVSTFLNNVNDHFYTGSILSNTSYQFGYSLDSIDSTGAISDVNDVNIIGSAVNNFTLSDGEYYISSIGYTEGFFSTGGLIEVPDWESSGGLVISNVGTTDGTILSLGESTVSFQAVPEPSSIALLGLGGFALVLRRKRTA